ncbi:hypothetical protein CLV76_107183 [Marivita geojedonensis]|nr:hypothetical protein CLV76_107183 [Marivita geojedonensis]
MWRQHTELTDPASRQKLERRPWRAKGTQRNRGPLRASYELANAPPPEQSVTLLVRVWPADTPINPGRADKGHKPKDHGLETKSASQVYVSKCGIDKFCAGQVRASQVLIQKTKWVMVGDDSTATPINTRAGRVIRRGLSRRCHGERQTQRQTGGTDTLTDHCVDRQPPSVARAVRPVMHLGESSEALWKLIRACPESTPRCRSNTKSGKL